MRLPFRPPPRRGPPFDELDELWADIGWAFAAGLLTGAFLAVLWFYAR